jgi:anti-anti-sigma factor
MIYEITKSRGSLRAQQLVKLGRLGMTSQREGDVHTIGLSGELDLATVEGVQRELECVEASDVEAIVVDLSGLTFVDSSGVRLVVLADVRSRADSERLTLLRGPASVQRVFALSGFEDRLPFAD